MGELGQEVFGAQSEQPEQVLPEYLTTRQRHIEETRAELLAMGESAEAVQQWLQPHVNELQAEIASLNSTPLD